MLFCWRHFDCCGQHNLGAPDNVLQVETEVKFKTKPYAHQLECLNKFGRHRAFALLAEMGTGKTWIIINNVADLWTTGDCDAMLVFAPNGVHTNWTRLELPQHMPDSVHYRAVAWATSKSQTYAREVESLYREPQAHHGIPILRILTMNWESLQNARGFAAAERFVKSADKLMIVCDESDSIKNPKAKRTKNLFKLGKFSLLRRIMTGTPVNNAPFDVFSQFQFLDAEILGTSSYYAFKAEYAEMLKPGNPLLEHIAKRTRFTPQIVARGVGGRPKYKNLDKLSKLIAPHSFRVLKADCLDLPDKIYKTLSFDLTAQQKVAYRKMKSECRLLFEDDETPFSKLVAITKLSQITSGYILHPQLDEPIRIEGKTPKMDMLIDRVEAIVNAGDKVIVWARYRIEIADIVKRLREAKIGCVQYHGGIKKNAREEAIDNFESREDTPVFVGNQQAGGRGITLVAANFVIYFSNNFSLRDRLQSEDRAHRIGQTRKVTYINIAARGTIDETVIEALLNKKDVADTIIDKGLKLFEEGEL